MRTPTILTPLLPLALALGLASTAAAQTITVTTLNDVSDFSGARQAADLPGPDGRVSFREALLAADNTPGPQTIAFAIPTAEFWFGAGVATLRLEGSAFSLNDDGTTIDFSTQTANIGDTNPSGAEVGIYGLQPNGLGIAALFINGNGCTVKGLGEVRQRGYGVQLNGNNNRVIGCQIAGPLYAGVGIAGSIGGLVPTGNIIGGTEPGEGNILSGGNSGVRIDGPADGNIVIGNLRLSGPAAGVEVRGATRYGVIVTNTRIGGPTPAERNIIAGAGSYGQEGFPGGAQVSIVDADGTLVEGNYIGTTADGMSRMPQVGPAGVQVRDSRSTTIRGNVIAGLRVEGRNHYAGQVFGQAVSISAANETTSDTLVENNLIGLAADGVTPILTRAGISVTPLRSTVHALNTRLIGNQIAGVETTGIFVSIAERGVTISRNSIHDCGGLGIDLAGPVAGVTPNDPGDADSGANNLQNFPVLTAAGPGAITGSLNSTPSQAYVIEFFSSPACDPLGFGEGQRFAGSLTVATDASGRADFSFPMNSDVTPGSAVTATATRVSTGDTSEFSACVTATGPSCAPDFNADGTLDPDDLSDYITCFFQEAALPGACPQADFNADGQANADDLSDYITAYFTGC